jgi:hypothetical protein
VNVLDVIAWIAGAALIAYAIRGWIGFFRDR